MIVSTGGFCCWVGRNRAQPEQGVGLVGEAGGSVGGGCMITSTVTNDSCMTASTVSDPDLTDVINTALTEAAGCSGSSLGRYSLPSWGGISISRKHFFF